MIDKSEQLLKIFKSFIRTALIKIGIQKYLLRKQQKNVQHNTKNLLLHSIALTIRKSDRTTTLNSKY